MTEIVDVLSLFPLPLRLSRRRTLADELVFSSIEIVPAFITNCPHSMPSVKRFTLSVEQRRNGTEFTVLPYVLTPC